jgi:uncharacterized membrane protein
MLTHAERARAYIHVGADRHHHGGQCADADHSGQRKMVEAMSAGRMPDPVHGQKAKQRSVHNNYFTLPVLFIMISNHYAMTYRNDMPGWCWPLSWRPASSFATSSTCATRARGRYPAIGVALAGGGGVVACRSPVAVAARRDPAAEFAVHAIIAQRCATCHSAHPTQPGFATAPLGVLR